MDDCQFGYIQKLKKEEESNKIMKIKNCCKPFADKFEI
jgi:hypothetical protein